jgi:hypothetical protein
MPGSEISLPAEGARVQISATACSAQPFELIDIVQNGAIIARADAENGMTAKVEIEATISQSSWIAARCYGRGKLQTRHTIDIAAHTSPVYVTVGGQRQTSVDDASYLLTLLEGGKAYLEKLAVWRSETQREHHLACLERGRQAILRRHPQARPQWEHVNGGKHDE